MPTTTEQINALESELAGIALAIYDREITLATQIVALDNALRIFEADKAEQLKFIMEERFTINNQLRYTNDDQRKTALIEALQNSADYQLSLTEKRDKQRDIDESKANIDLNRNLHKAKLTTLEYFATTENNTPTATPPPTQPPSGTTAGTTGAIVFESAAGFSINANSIARIAGNPYQGIAIAAQALNADGKISFKLNSVTEGLRIYFSEQANQFEISFLGGGNIQLRRNGTYQSDALIADPNGILSFQRTGTSVKFYENQTLRGEFSQQSSGAARLSVTAPNEPASIGAGIKEAFIENI